MNHCVYLCCVLVPFLMHCSRLVNTNKDLLTYLLTNFKFDQYFLFFLQTMRSRKVTDQLPLEQFALI